MEEFDNYENALSGIYILITESKEDHIALPLYSIVIPSRLGVGVINELSILITNNDDFLNYMKYLERTNQKVEFEKMWKMLHKKKYTHLTRKELFNRYSYGDQHHRNLPGWLDPVSNNVQVNMIWKERKKSENLEHFSSI